MSRREQQPKIPKDGKLTPRLAFALVLRERRKALGLSQTDLEDPDEIDASYISKLELAQRQVCLDSLIYLAGRLQMSPEELVAEVMSRVRK